MVDFSAVSIEGEASPTDCSFFGALFRLFQPYCA